MLKLDFTLKYVPGTKMRKVDELSRRLDWKVRIKNDNNSQTLIKEQWIFKLAEVIIERSEVKIKIARSKNIK